MHAPVLTACTLRRARSCAGALLCEVWELLSAGDAFPATSFWQALQRDAYLLLLPDRRDDTMHVRLDVAGIQRSLYW